MREHESYILTNLEEKIKFLNSVNYDYQVIKNPGLSTSKIHEIRRQFHLGSYKEALRKYIEEEIRSNLRSYEYEQLCKFLMDNGFESDITLIPDENLRIKYLKRMENQTAKATVLASIADDGLKKEYLSGFKKESDRMIILCSLSTDEQKLECFNKITDYHKQADLIASLDSDDLKLEYIFSGKIRPYTIANVVATLKNDQKKEELVDLVPSDTARLRVILSIKDDEMKKRLFEEKIQSDSFKQRKKPALVLSLSIDEQLRRFNEFDDGVKVMILQNCDFETQMKLLPMIEDDEKKKVVFERIPSEFLIKYMAFNYGDTTNFWVRTDSEEREANVPRDDREEMTSEVVKFSDIPPASKVALIRTYVKDKPKIKELLKFIPYEVVISDYFMIKKDAINVGMLDQISEFYDIESMCDVTLTADRNFDFTASENIALIDRVKKMKYPKFVLDRVSYEDYRKWESVFEGTDVIIMPSDINITNSDLSLDELKKLAAVCEYAIIGNRVPIRLARHCNILELSRRMFPLGENEKFDSVRKEIETHLDYEWYGYVLVNSQKTFMNAGFTEEEIQMCGERLVNGLHNLASECNMAYTCAMEEDAVELLHKWDATHSILKNDLVAMSSQMTQTGIKRATEIALEEGFISEDFAISHILNYLSTNEVPKVALGYAERIALELMHSQGVNVNDVGNMRPGAFSDVFSIGDFVLKLGISRQTKSIPKHDRILPSLLRFEVEEGGNAVSSFIEVQPKVRICNEIDEDSIAGEDLMYDVYSDLRDSQIVWGDAAKRNLGFVEKDVVIPQGLFSRLRKELETTEGVTTYHEDNPTFVNRANSDDKPYLYVVDTDFLYKVDEEKDNHSLAIPSSLSYQYEQGYQNIKRFREQMQSKKGRREVKKLKEDIDEIFE